MYVFWDNDGNTAVQLCYYDIMNADIHSLHSYCLTTYPILGICHLLHIMQQAYIMPKVNVDNSTIYTTHFDSTYSTLLSSQNVTIRTRFRYLDL